MMLRIRVVVVRREKRWSAVGLDFFLASSGNTPVEAQLSFVRTVRANIDLSVRNNEKLLEGFDPAPDEYWQLYDKANDIRRRKMALHISESAEDAVLDFGVVDE